MFRLTVRRRIIIVLLIVLLVPLGVANIIWLESSQQKLRIAAADQQELLVKSSADAVTSYLDNKVNAAVIHSQTQAVQSVNLASAQPELQQYLEQDKDLKQVALVDATGIQRLLVNRSGVQLNPVDMAASDAFRVVTFLGGEEYFSPVTFDAQHDADVTLAVPLVHFSSAQTGTRLSTAQPGVILAPTAIKGALIVSFDLQSLWDSVLNHKLGESGYAYVVDDQGNLIAYPNQDFLAHHPNVAGVPEVKAALAETQQPGAQPLQPAPHTTGSETGKQVLSSHLKVARTGWTVVAEEPTAGVYAPVINDEQVAALFFAVSVLIGLGLILLLARSLLRPISALEEGARRFAAGDLSYRVQVRHRDEFSLLADTMNQMAEKISADFTKLREVDQLKNEFIAIASHNLRTPLTIMKGYIEVLKADTRSKHAKGVVAAIERGTHDLAGFSEDLLTISSIESGNATISPQAITVGELLGPVKKIVEASAKHKQINLVWWTPDDSLSVTLSPIHVRNIISNLLKNAVEFTPEKGQVEFAFQVEPDNFVITVKDNGTGISPEEMDRLFTKFHRATDTMQYDHPGTGIGLYVTLLLVEAHNGHVKVASQVGKGSAFTVTLPARAGGA
jgi:signal transduction histidine kinase